MPTDDEAVSILQLGRTADGEQPTAWCRQCWAGLHLDEEAAEVLKAEPGALLFCVPCGDDLLLWAVEHGGLVDDDRLG